MSAWRLLKETLREAQQDDIGNIGAALAFYTIFSIAPMLLIVIAVAGFFLGEEAVAGRVHAELLGMLGDAGAKTVEDLVESARKPATGIFATTIGVLTLLIGASGVLTQLRRALNIVWKAPPKKISWMTYFRRQLLSFATVLVLGFILLVSLVVSATLSAMTAHFGGQWIAELHLAAVLDFLMSVAVTTLLFALMYRVLPDVKIAWRGAWVGALVTAILFNVGKYLVGLYLGRGSVASAYGAAGTALIVLLWVYYSAQITLLGAEFTQVYARTKNLRLHER